jgi:phosphatidylglycerol lysyltransferase
LLDRRQFGIDFSLAESIRKTLAYSVFLGDPSLTPHTRYAAWFLDSLYLISAAAIAYAVAAVFRPVVYLYRTMPHERDLAKQIVERHGASATDFFKYWPDKTFFFSSSHNSFLAYHAAAGFALVLGDPVGPEEELPGLVREFQAMCDGNDWDAAFYQVPLESLPLYESLGFRKLKVGDDAVVDLTAFSLQGKTNSKLRSKVNQFTKLGITFVNYRPPVPAQVLAQAHRVSDSWLSLPGRRERTFALGQFDPDYVRQTPVYAALDASGKMLGFVNVIPSFRKGEATVDLMRHSADSPPGTMDFIFTKVMLALKDQGFKLFNMGMAPMTGFQPQEKPGPEEKATHYLLRHLNFIFNYRSLREYKAKFATIWEPRYLVYRNVAQLPLLGRAMVEITELHK